MPRPQPPEEQHAPSDAAALAFIVHRRAVRCSCGGHVPGHRWGHDELGVAGAGLDRAVTLLGALRRHVTEQPPRAASAGSQLGVAQCEGPEVAKRLALPLVVPGAILRTAAVQKQSGVLSLPRSDQAVESPRARSGSSAGSSSVSRAIESPRGRGSFGRDWRASKQPELRVRLRKVPAVMSILAEILRQP